MQLPSALPLNNLYAPELVSEIEHPANDLTDEQLIQNMEKQTPVVLATNLGGARETLTTNNTLQELAAWNVNGLIYVGLFPKTFNNPSINGSESILYSLFLNLFQSIPACFPEVWPDFVTKSLQSDEPVLPTVRCAVRTLVQRMSDRQMLEDSDFVDVADEALRRMPHLRIKSANSGVSN